MLSGPAGDGPVQADPGADGVAVRVLSYNVRSLRDDAAAVAAVIRAVRPDVACIQEAPRFLRWRSKCAALARESELLVVAGGRTAGAVLLLASLRARVVRAEQVLLPRRPGRHQRGVALAVLDVGGARFAVATTHLSLDADERVEQAGRVTDLLAGLGEAAAVLAADVNDGPGSPAWTAFTRAGFRDACAGGASWVLGGSKASAAAATFPAAAPDRRIDGIFVSTGLVVRRCRVPDDIPGLAAASDHLPVVTDLRILPA